MKIAFYLDGYTVREVLRGIVKGKRSDAPLSIIHSNLRARKCSSAAPWCGNTEGKPSSDSFIDWHSHTYEIDNDYYEDCDDYSYDD